MRFFPGFSASAGDGAQIVRFFPGSSKVPGMGHTSLGFFQDFPVSRGWGTHCEALDSLVFEFFSIDIH